MQCANVTEWRHEVRRVLIDFKEKKLLTAPIYRMLLKYNIRISMGKLNGNKNMSHFRLLLCDFF